MAEGRMLKKKISVSEQVADLGSDTNRLLFTWGIAHLDVEGRMTANPRKFKALVCPMLDHVTCETIVNYFSDAKKHGLIEIYECSGEWFLQYPTFSNHQNLRKDREAQSSIPDNSGVTPAQLQDNSGSAPAEVKLSQVKVINKKIPESYSEDFEKFWAEYPRKEGKSAAFKCWKARLKDGGTPEGMILAARKYAFVCKQQNTEQHFCKMPKTFLNPDWIEWRDREMVKSQPDYLNGLAY